MKLKDLASQESSYHVIKVELSWHVSFVSRFVLCYLTSRIIVARLRRIDDRINDPLSFGDYMGQRYYIFSSRLSQKYSNISQLCVHLILSMQVDVNCEHCEF